MFKTEAAPRHFSRQMLHVTWVEKGEITHLATLDRALWRDAEKLGNPAGGRCERDDFQRLLLKGARSFALKALSRRNRSRGWVFEQLVRAGVTKPIADRVSREMAERGYADDQTLGGRILQEARGRGRGAHWVKGELKKHRLSEERIESLVQSRAREEVASLTDWLHLQGNQLKIKLPAAERLKLFQKLMRRGYSLQSIELALANWREQMEF